MPAVHPRYRHRNACIGIRVVYRLRPTYTRSSAEGRPIEDGTVATIIDVYDFDMPFLYELEDGRRTRSGGLSWRWPED